MLEPSDDRRRALLILLASAMAAASALLALPTRSMAKAQTGLPGFLDLLASRDLCRQARRQAQSQPCGPSAVQAARAVLHDPEGAGARFERAVRQDFIVGRVVVVQGWVMAETELTLLAMVER